MEWRLKISNMAKNTGYTIAASFIDLILIVFTLNLLKGLRLSDSKTIALGLAISAVIIALTLIIFKSFIIKE